MPSQQVKFVNKIQIPNKNCIKITNRVVFKNLFSIYGITPDKTGIVTRSKLIQNFKFFNYNLKRRVQLQFNDFFKYLPFLEALNRCYHKNRKMLKLCFHNLSTIIGLCTLLNIVVFFFLPNRMD